MKIVSNQFIKMLQTMKYIKKRIYKYTQTTTKYEYTNNYKYFKIISSRYVNMWSSGLKKEWKKNFLSLYKNASANEIHKGTDI